MNIKQLTVTPLHLPLKTPYIWSQGVEDAFYVNLITLEADDGTLGYGETTTAPGLGFELDLDVVNAAAERFAEQ